MSVPANLGGVGGGAAGGYSASSAADSANKIDYQNAHNAVAGAGNRGFTSNVAFPGSTLNADAGINEPSLIPSRYTQYALWAGLGVLALAVLKKLKG